MNKIVLITIGAICIVSAVTAHVINQPKNVFDEIYYAEMRASELGHPAPLSDTAYFNVTHKAPVKRSARQVVTESPKEMGPYTLSVRSGYKKDIWTVTHRSKRVTITSTFVYRDVEIKVRYSYILYMYNNFDMDIDRESRRERVRERELTVFLENSIEGYRDLKFSDFEKYGISEAELKERIKEDLGQFLNYWVDNYEGTKFKTDRFGEYEINWVDN